jgi:hypothetical protein
MLKARYLCGRVALVVELRNREREYAGSNTGALKTFFSIEKKLPAPGNWRNMPFTGTVTGHDNWPILGRFWSVAWVPSKIEHHVKYSVTYHFINGSHG